MDYKEIKIRETFLKVYRDGSIERLVNYHNPKTFVVYPKWKRIKLKPMTDTDEKYQYYKITLNKKNYRVSRIVAYAWLNFDLDSELHIDHINHNPLDNSIDNLRPLTCLENQQNRRPRTI